jgi:hypothetical protein
MPRVHEMLPQSRSVITPTTGMWERLDDDMRAFLADIAANVRILLGRGRADDAVDEIESHKLEPENFAALWTQFDSGERSVLKAVMAARRAKL